jgi:DNA-3-methyladenine glycosylase II
VSAPVDTSGSGAGGPGAILDAAAFERVMAALVDADGALARIVVEHGAPPFWSRPAGYRALVLLILEQQVSLASAEAAYRRIRERVRTVTPEAILACSPEELRADGVSRQKDRYLRALSEAVATGALDLDALAAHDDETVRAELIALPGIGRWTADVYLLACLGRPDLWPVGDRALQVAVAEALDLPEAVALEVLGERWRPHRSSAARLLWHGYLGRRNRVETRHDLLDDLL